LTSLLRQGSTLEVVNVIDASSVCVSCSNATEVTPLESGSDLLTDRPGLWMMRWADNRRGAINKSAVL
jgi:hypothetical protein